MRRPSFRRVIAVGLSLVAGLSSLYVLEVASAPPAAAAGSHRVLITGDSITQGSNGDYTWRYRLFKKLQSTAPGSFEFVGPDTRLFDHVTNTYTSTNYLDPNFAGKAHAARWGTTFIDQLPHIGEQVRSSNANVLVVMLGSNDLAYRTSPAQTVANLRKYIQSARAAAPGIDVVVGEVVTRWDPWTQSTLLGQQTAEYKTRAAELARELNTTSQRVVVAPTLTGWNPHSHTWDGSHPNAAGETLIAQRVSEGLAALGLGSSAPNIYNPGARWSMKAPAPTVSAGTEQSTVSWSLQSTGSTGMFISYHADMPGQSWVHLPYPVGATEGNQWTVKPLAGGANYNFALIANKGFMPSDQFGSVVTRTVAGITPAIPKGVDIHRVPTTPTSGAQFKVTWDSAANATGYLLGHKVYPTTQGRSEFPYPVLGTSWTLQHLPTGRYQSFAVRSAREFVKSSWADTATRRSSGIPAHARYAVLGDSYAAGNGLYNNTDDYDDPECLRAMGSWSSHFVKFYEPLRSILACSGADATQVRTEQVPLATMFLDWDPNAAQMITVSAGGNDVGFRDMLLLCFGGVCNTDNQWTNFQERLATAESNLTHLYTTLRARFGYADIVAMGYPSPIGDVTGGTNICNVNVGGVVGFTAGEAEFIRRGTTSLNNTIDRVGRGVRDVWVGSGTQIQDAFRGHGACDAAPWIHAVDRMNNIKFDGNSFHQTPEGHLRYGFVMNGYFNDVTR